MGAGKKILNQAVEKIKQKAKVLLIKAIPYIIAAVGILIILTLLISAFYTTEGHALSTTIAGNSSDGYTSASGTSMFYDNSFTKEEFVEKAKDYSPGHNQYQSSGRYTDDYYKTAFVEYAEEYFDISTQYGFDPRITFCTGLQESYYGTSDIAVDKCNYWGLGAVDSDPYNGAYTYSSVEEGIKSLCELFKEYVTEGTDKNRMILDRGYDPTTIEGVGSIYATDGNWANLKKQFMKDVFGWEENKIDTSTFLSTAIGVWKGVCSRFQNYGGTSIVPTGNTIDCSAYVSWVLYEYGYESFAGAQTWTGALYDTNWNEKYGWTEIEIRKHRKYN